ncbi:MAG: RNA-binding S4 domain-containing protein [Clostridia bacterium]|nr:RNA-binding S4 domain-containing protein [Clostridia bacterium]
MPAEAETSVPVARLPIRLDDFLKLAGAVPTGGQAKALVRRGEVAVNGEVETRRGRRLFPGDRVTLFGATYRVTAHEARPGDDG